jgi:hypothetical protein
MLMRHSLRIAAVAATLPVMALAGQAMATTLVLPAPYNALFIWNDNGTVSLTTAPLVEYTAVQQQSELWSDFTGTDLPAGTIMQLSLATIDGMDHHTISFLGSFGALGGTYTVDYDVTETFPTAEASISGAILQTVGVSTLGKSITTNSGPYSLSFTQTGATVTSGTTTVDFTNYTVSVGVTDTLTISSVPGSDATGFSNSLVESAIPEPSTWAMMILGFIGLGYAAIRRGRKERSLAV